VGAQRQEERRPGGLVDPDAKVGRNTDDDPRAVPACHRTTNRGLDQYTRPECAYARLVEDRHERLLLDVCVRERPPGAQRHGKRSKEVRVNRADESVEAAEVREPSCFYRVLKSRGWAERVSHKECRPDDAW
jgi:hypothetical protein